MNPMAALTACPPQDVDDTFLDVLRSRMEEMDGSSPLESHVFEWDEVVSVAISLGHGRAVLQDILFFILDNISSLDENGEYGGDWGGRLAKMTVYCARFGVRGAMEGFIQMLPKLATPADSGLLFAALNENNDETLAALLSVESQEADLDDNNIVLMAAERKMSASIAAIAAHQPHAAAYEEEHQPLVHALRAGNRDPIDQALEAGDLVIHSLYHPVLRWAGALGYTDLTLELMQSIRPPLRQQRESVSSSGRTIVRLNTALKGDVISACASNGHVELLVAVLAAITDSMLSDDKSLSDLIHDASRHAAAAKQYDTVALLVRHPAFGHERDDGFTLAKAVDAGAEDIVELLVTFPDTVVNAWHNVALVHACNREHTRIVELLLSHPRCNPNFFNPVDVPQKRGNDAILALFDQHPAFRGLDKE